MECKRLPADYKIRDFSLKMVFLIQNSGLVVSLKHKKPTQWAGCIKSDFISNIQFSQHILHSH